MVKMSLLCLRVRQFSKLLGSFGLKQGGEGKWNLVFQPPLPCC